MELQLSGRALAQKSIVPGLSPPSRRHPTAGLASCELFPARKPNSNPLLSEKRLLCISVKHATGFFRPPSAVPLPAARAPPVACLQKRSSSLSDILLPLSKVALSACASVCLVLLPTQSHALAIPTGTQNQESAQILERGDSPALDGSYSAPELVSNSDNLLLNSLESPSAIPVRASPSPSLPLVAASGESGTSPYFQEKDWQQLGLLEGRIRPCPTALNPNCVSTSSLNRSYGEPWIIPPGSLSTAPKKIETAIQLSQNGTKILTSEETQSGHYILAEVDGPFGKDTLEFLVKTEDELVLFRSMAGKVVYVYPFTTPITDFDAQRKHVAAVKEELGWAQLAGACDYGVCSEYEDAEDEETIKVEPRIFPF